MALPPTQSAVRLGRQQRDAAPAFDFLGAPGFQAVNLSIFDAARR
jgi:hypothetical protein